jgi:hypothetical protein
MLHPMRVIANFSGPLGFGSANSQAQSLMLPTIDPYLEGGGHASKPWLPQRVTSKKAKVYSTGNNVRIIG